MEIWFSTHNENKLTEFKQLLKDLPLEIHSAGEMDYFSAPPETGETFVDNARIKAKALRSLKNQSWVIAVHCEKAALDQEFKNFQCRLF